MCGICGTVYFDEHRQVREKDLIRMSDTLFHRGPDGSGVWIDNNVGLAHRRLAIIDLREHANQPMSNEDGSVWVTFNGEIYNFQELRQVLQQKGHRFRTTSDTEVIVHAYEEYGRACVEHFRGMFAFAIWDRRQRKLFLARDRVGKKPLYYHVGPDRFVFGSEIKALLADPDIPREPDPVAIDHFLGLQYIPAPLTAFRGIYKLPAAHWLELHRGRLEMGQYWKLRYVPKRMISIPDALEELQSQMAEAVRLRMISDVPLGAFLSGGVDSTAVVIAMAKEATSAVKTFCAGFDDGAFDEREFAKIVAQRYGLEHTELLVKAPVHDILPRLVWHYDEPFGDSSAVPSFAIAQLTREHVTVVLNGDGGDENFAGYDRYVTDRFVRNLDVLPLSIRRIADKAVHALPDSWQRAQPFRKLARWVHVLAQRPGRRYARWGAHFQAEDRTWLYTSDFQGTVTHSDPEGLFERVFEESDTKDCTDEALAADVNLYLTDDLLVKMDRATMAHSLETRSPLLDHVLMEFVATLPSHMKLSGGTKKFLLKESIRGQVPDLLLDRPKMGFCAPLEGWFRTELREMVHDVLLSSRAKQRGYFQQDRVEGLLHKHCAEGDDHGAQLWDLLVLELWHQTFIDGLPNHLS
ncbi:asparagine synthase (glutamine-hydrolyzing) [Candidatus Nitronereus thalassa]|uniref:asparagine synthase (glutamine-hydrolyzing) n=1 Tax=Candidatus Nitronereus thalassa TaxID=3020898 RepID=A0ABU3K6I3_9BACT|nr:asparagine synthase (glutamine-hydrolyzing) [Candidatus Nitronereus thalassa]MDT7041979.1 asparagine synthase (glutamine-hydrolyzing) [Candidatus Nitronereus thalassa]